MLFGRSFHTEVVNGLGSAYLGLTQIKQIGCNLKSVIALGADRANSARVYVHGWLHSVTELPYQSLPGRGRYPEPSTL